MDLERTRTKRSPARIAAIALVAVAAVALTILAIDVALIAFGSVLFAVFLHGVASGFQRLRLPYPLALLAACLALIAVVGTAAWLMAPSVSQQIEQLAERLPQSARELGAWLERFTWGRWLVERAGDSQQQMGEGGLKKAAGWLGTTLGMVVNAAIVGVVGLYLAAQPRLYVAGLEKLLPHGARRRSRQILAEVGFELRWWLLGQMAAMALVGVLTWLGLWAIGVPLALALGIIAGLLNFVPNIGPWIAAIPGVMIALAVKPSLAVWAALVYLGAQILESYVITPLIQQRNVHLAPALLILAQLLMAVLVGPVAVIMAAPLLVIAVVLVKMLWVEDHLGDRAALPGRDG